MIGEPTHFIRSWRKFRGFSQAQLSQRIGVEVSYVSKIESGKRRYDERFLQAVATALECGVADLIARDPQDPEGIWFLWGAMGPAERRQAVEVIKAIKRTGTNG